MNFDESKLQELEDKIKKVNELKTDDFFEICEILELDPLNDFERFDLSDADLMGKNLEHANFRGTNLTRANLIDTKLSFVDLSDANLSDADLSGAILVETNFNNAIVKGTKFQDNFGICKEQKLRLIDNGAIFLDAIPKTLPYHELNLLLSEKLNDLGFSELEHKYAAIAEGELLQIGDNEDDLFQSLKRNQSTHKLLVELNKEPTIVELPSSFSLDLVI